MTALVVSSFALLCFHGVYFCVYLVGGVVGRGHLMIVCTLVGQQAPCFSTGSILTK